MNNHTINKVREFHVTFRHPVEQTPTTPSAAVRKLRFRLLLEEVLEYGQAIGVAEVQTDSQIKAVVDCFTLPDHARCDQVAAADALTDIDYVCQGGMLVHGFPAEALAAEVHASNMSKLGADGLPIWDAAGKVVKGPNYRKPDIAAVLARFAPSNHPTAPTAGPL